MKQLTFFLGLSLLLSCTSAPKAERLGAPKEEAYVEFEIQELTDEAYPDNPDIGFRAQAYAHAYFGKGKLIPQGNMQYTFVFETETSDSIVVDRLDLSEFIPTVPQHVAGDEYMKYIALINQEWNRNQVRFNLDQFSSTDQRIQRIDIARNCLNSYLWEVIAYTEEEGKQVPVSHGWFNFPKEVYAELFEVKNGISFSAYQKPMEDWVDPETKPISRELLRSVEQEVEVKFADLSDNMYPVEGARKKKFKEIIYPESFATMRDLQNDSTLYATFTPPGFYNKADPRKTELGRIRQLKDVYVRQIKSSAEGSETALEIELIFTDQEERRTTKLVLGGLDPGQYPALSPQEANKGWSCSMGIGNHPFYETYEVHQHCKASSNPYYAYLCNEKEEWLDSHAIGIDGPIFHWDEENKNLLHLWLLSFERHSLVGHYTLEFPSQNPIFARNEP